MSNTQVRTITQANLGTAVNAALNEMTSLIETLDQRDVDTKPIRSGWSVVSGDT